MMAAPRTAALAIAAASCAVVPDDLTPQTLGSADDKAIAIRTSGTQTANAVNPGFQRKSSAEFAFVGGLTGTPVTTRFA
jgi:hypothetical protein